MTPGEFRESAARAILASHEEAGTHLEHALAREFLRGRMFGLREAADIVRSHPVASPWIAVGDRLPEPDVEVLAITEHGNYHLACFVTYLEEGPRWIDEECLPLEPTHWMPLPEPPTEPAS